MKSPAAIITAPPRSKAYRYRWVALATLVVFGIVKRLLGSWRRNEAQSPAQLRQSEKARRKAIRRQLRGLEPEPAGSGNGVSHRRPSARRQLAAR